MQPPARRLTISVLLLGVALLLGCGDEDAGDAPVLSPAAVRLVDPDRATGVYTIEGRQAIASGAVRFTLSNPTKKERGAQIIRVDAGHDVVDAFEALSKVREGAPMPKWLQWAGGIGVIRPGRRQVFTVSLPPGSFYVVDRSYEGQPSKLAAVDALARLEVTQAGRSAGLPQATASITATEYSFASRGLAAGANAVRLENKGTEPHDFVLSPIVAGKTLDDVKKFATGEEESEPPPVDFEREVISGVLAGGTQQTMQLDLQPGRYALLCFASDRAGGPPHVVRGMVSEMTIE